MFYATLDADGTSITLTISASDANRLFSALADKLTESCIALESVLYEPPNARDAGDILHNISYWGKMVGDDRDLLARLAAVSGNILTRAQRERFVAYDGGTIPEAVRQTIIQEAAEQGDAP